METIAKPIVASLPQKNFVMEGIVNGLIATAILWIFWTPFLIAVVVPVSSAIVKGFVCNALKDGLKPSRGMFGSSQGLAKTMLEHNPKNITIENQFYYSSFVIMAILVIPISLFFANYIINLYNLDRTHIIVLNVIMFFVISGIEGFFFVTVGTQYVPWSINTIVEYVSSYIKTFPNE